MSRSIDKPEMNLTREVPFGEYRSVVLPYADNKVKTRRFTCSNALQQLSLHLFQSLGYLWLLLIASVDCALLARGDESDTSTLTVVFLGLAVVLLRETLQEFQRIATDKKTNAMPCKIWDGQEFVEVSSSEVLCGDLLFVGNAQQVVADCVLFFSERPDGSCYIDNSATLGATQMTQKYAVADIQRFCESSSIDRLLSTLTKIKGLIRTTQPNPDFNSFSGQIRLFKSPSASVLTMSNFILKGSRVYGAKWAVGCVVAAGMDTKVMLSSLASAQTENPLKRTLRRYCFYAIGASLLLILCNALGAIITNTDSADIDTTILVSFSRYFRLIPAALFLMLDIVRTAQTFRANRNPVLEGKVRIDSLTSSFKFGQVDYVIAEKNCVLTCSRPRVHTIIYRERMFGHCEEYFHGKHSCQQVYRRMKTYGANVIEQCYLFTEKRPSGDTVDGSEIQLQKTVEESKNSCGFRILESQLTPNDSDDLSHLFECMVLCNTITQLDPLKARNKHEEALVECGDMFGFRVLESFGDRTMLEIAGQRIVCKILASHYDAKTSEEMTIILDKSDRCSGMVYSKGSIDNLGGYLAISDDLREHIRSMAMELKRTGLLPIVFACKQLDDDQLELVKDKLWKAHSAMINVNVKVEAIVGELRRELKYLGVACVEDTIGTDCAEGIHKLGLAGVGLWVVSSDPEIETMSSCMSIGLMGYEGYIVPITNIKETFECTKLLGSLVTEFIYRKPLTQDDDFSLPTPRTSHFAPRIERLMSELLPNFSRGADSYRHILMSPFDPMNVNFSIVVDGVSFETAMKEDQTQCLLAALLFLSKGVCFCGMLPHHKASVVKFLRNSFAFQPVVLTIADGLNSIPMLEASDLRVGVERVTFDEAPYLFHAEVTSLSALADFIITTGRRSYKGIREVVLLLVYENALILSLMMYYTGLSGFTAASPIDWQSVWAVLLVATKPAMFYIGIFYEDIDDQEAINNPQTYRWRSPPLQLRSILKIIFLAFVHGMILHIIAVIGLSNAISANGYTENGDILTAILSVSSLVTISAQMVIRYECLSLNFLLSVLSGFFLFFIEVIALNYADNDIQDYMSKVSEFSVSFSRMLLSPMASAMLMYYMENRERLRGQSYASYLINGDFMRDRVDKYSENLMNMWVPSEVMKSRDAGDLFERTKFTRTFKLPLMEANYQANIIPELNGHIKVGYGLMTLLAAVCFTVVETNQAAREQTWLRALFVVGSCTFLITSCTKLYRRYFSWVNIAGLCFCIISVAVYQGLSSLSSPEVVATVPIFSFLCFSVSFAVVLGFNIVNLVLYISIAVLNIVIPADDSYKGLLLLLSNASYVTAITVSMAFVGHFVDEMNREKFCLLTTKEIELEKGDNVLKYLLPDFVRTRVKDGIRFIAEIQPMVHILFCELCGFDAMIQEYEAIEVTSLLNKIYQKFDEVCETCGVTKIETVGKVYMACTGIKESEQDLRNLIPKLSGVQRLLFCAFEMISTIDQFRLADGKAIKIKIGIHSGTVIAGVVGYHKPQFSLVGDTVNTASRMCSTLDKENFVQISMTTYELLKNTYGVMFEKRLQKVKGKGLMEVYLAIKDIETKSYRATLEAPDGSLEMSKLGRRKSLPIARGMTIAHRDSIFEGNSEVIKAFQGRKIETKWWNVKHLKIFSDTNYRNGLVIKRKTAIRGLITLFVQSLVNVAVECGELIVASEEWQSLPLRAVSCILLWTLLILSIQKFTHEKFNYVSSCLLSLVLACYLIDLFFVNDSQNYSSDFAMVLLVTIALVHFTGMRSYQLLPVILAVGAVVAGAYVHLECAEREAVRMGVTLGIMAVYLVYVCYRDVRLQNYIELKQVVQAEIEKTDNLLENLLPQHVLESLRVESLISDRLENTTLLVADIVGFTAYSTGREPSEVIEMLSNMFSKFDKLCVNFKAYKVYTIGDCYIAMGFSGKKQERDPKQECVNIVKMAFKLKEVIAQVNDDQFTQLDMRIGVHTGEIIGAVVGTNIVRYDIYGRDVLIAFKMEANSLPGMVNVSEASRAFLEDVAPDLFEYEYNNTIDISAIKAQIPCYFVREKEDQPLQTSADFD